MAEMEEDDHPVRRRYIPPHVKTLGKIDLSEGQRSRWFRVDAYALKRLCEDFGFSGFTIEDAEDTRDDISGDSNDTLDALMKRLVRRGWLEQADEEYYLTEQGHAQYESLS